MSKPYFTAYEVKEAYWLNAKTGERIPVTAENMPKAQTATFYGDGGAQTVVTVDKQPGYELRVVVRWTLRRRLLHFWWRVLQRLGLA